MTNYLATLANFVSQLSLAAVRHESNARFPLIKFTWYCLGRVEMAYTIEPNWENLGRNNEANWLVHNYMARHPEGASHG